MTSDDEKPTIRDELQAPAAGGPKGTITDTMQKPLVKRFYKTAAIAGAKPFQVLLDGRGVKTPAKRPLVLPTEAAARAVADEWSAQGASINPATMPLTRFANTAIDAVAESADAVAADIVSYAGRDLLCYRADGPPELSHAQAAKWDPVLDWAAKACDARFTVVAGIMPIDQPANALDAVASALRPHEPFRLTALHVMTTLTGSALLAIAHANGAIAADDAWSAAHVDEDYQIALWGFDEEAVARRAARGDEFAAASRFLILLTQ